MCCSRTLLVIENSYYSSYYAVGTTAVSIIVQASLFTLESAVEHNQILMECCPRQMVRTSMRATTASTAEYYQYPTDQEKCDYTDYTMMQI